MIPPCQDRDSASAPGSNNDEVAIKSMEAIRDAGLEVPRDVSVIGYDNSHLAEACLPKLTSINHPKEAMGSRAAELILDMVLGKSDKPRYTYKPELTVRSSCRQQPVDVSRV